MKRAPRSLQHHVLYRKYNGQDSEISALLGKCGIKTAAYTSVVALSWKVMGKSFEQSIRQGFGFRSVQIELDDATYDCKILGKAFPPSKVATTAVIILNYLHADDVQRLIGTLGNSTTDDYDIYVVDNCSPNLSEYDLAVLFGNVHVLRLPENVGYAAGNNAAMRLIANLPYSFVWILNPDMVVSPEALQQHIDAAAIYPDMALFGPVILRGDDKGRVASAGGYLSLADGLSTGHMYAGEMVSALPSQPYSVDFITGASVFLRSSVLPEIGYIPEDYFLYFEETDWLIQASRKGYKSLILPHIRLGHHKRSEEGGLPAKYYFYYYIRNSMLFSSRIGDENYLITEARLRNNFISVWLKKIGLRAPKLLPVYERLAEEGLADGKSGISGKRDLIALELSTLNMPAPLDEILCGCTVQIDDEGCLVGWVSVAGLADSACTVTVVNGDAVLANLTASVTKSDIVMGRVLTTQGFSTEIPAHFFNGKAHHFDIYVNGIAVPLAAVTKFLPRRAPKYQGRIDGIAQYCCTGWLWNAHDGEERIVAEILHEGIVIGRGVAENFRSDLATNNIGNGYAGFSIRLPKKFSDGRKHRFSLRVEGDQTVLFERDVLDDRIRGGIKPVPVRRALDDMFYERQFWLSAHALEDVPLGRYLLVVQNDLIARHAGRAQTHKFAVIMPAFNRADTILTSVHSVQAQSYQNWELLIIDDGSTDATVEVIESLLASDPDPRIHLIRLPQNLGVSAARNVGLAQARADAIAYLDSDNVWDPAFLSVMAGELMAHPEPVNTAYCSQRIAHVYGLDSQEEIIAIRGGPVHLAQIENRNFIDLNCFVHRHSMYKLHGGFNEAMRRLVDWELILRYASFDVPHYVPAMLSTYFFDKADNQITKLESYEQSLQQLTATANQLAAGVFADEMKLRSVDVVLLVQGNPDVLQLQLRIEEILTTLGSNPELRLIVQAPAETIELLDGYEQPRIRLQEVTDQRSFLVEALCARRPQADMALINMAALVSMGWLQAINRAIGKMPDGGIFITRQIVDGNRPDAKEHAPFASRERDICIALSARLRNVVNAELERSENLIEVSHFNPFCVYLPGSVAGAVPLVSETENSSLETFDELVEFVRFHLKRRIIYCGRANVFDQPL